MSNLQNHIFKVRKKHRLPGLVVITLDSKKILNTTYQGSQTYLKTDTLNENHYFHIGACSKSILGTIAAKLVEQNVISWKSEFFKIFPELVRHSHAAYHHITLEHLLTCRAGLEAWTDNWGSLPKFDNKNEKYQFAQYLFSQPPAIKFNQFEFEYLYSNASYSIAALLLERICNKDYNELIEDYISKPLNLDILFGFPNRIDITQPWGHKVTKYGIKIFSPSNDFAVPKVLVPAGDLTMKPRDFAKYVQLHLQGLRGENNYLSTTSYKQLHNKYHGFSFGTVNKKLLGLTIIAFDGSSGTFYCRAILIPKKDFGFIIMTNAGTDSGLLRAIDWLTIKIIKSKFKLWWKFWI